MSESERKELYLVDGHALAYRAYFATIRTPMSTASGQATGAVLGFTNSMLKLLGERACPYVAVVFDGAKPTFRHELYPEYKADREAMPDEMRSQMPLIFRLVEALNIPRIVWEGIEADDVLAWLATKAAAKGFRVWLVTKDKDLMQLVDDKVHLLAPENGGGLNDMGPAEVEAKMGVAPGKIRDLLALMGDSSDNVPGVPGIGPKTAAKILRQAGSVEHLLDEPALAGTPRLQQKIEQHRDDIILSRTLVTLHTETDLEIDIDTLQSRPMDTKACVELFTEMEFSALLRNPLFDIKEDVAYTVTVPRDIDEVKALAEQLARSGVVSIDTETTSTEAREAELVGLSVATSADHAWYIPVGHVNEPPRNLDCDEVLAVLRPIIESETIDKIGHNLKYDYQVLKNHGCTLRGIAFDTMVAAYLIEPGKRQYGLDAMAAQWLGVRMTPIEALIGKRGPNQSSFAQTAIDEAARYAGEDVVVPLRLRQEFAPLLAKRHANALFADMEMPLVTVLAEMEWQGIAIDGDLLDRLSHEYGTRLETISAEIYALAGEHFNLNSPKQIGELFYGKLGMPKGRRTKTGLSTNVEALEKLAPTYPIAQRLLDYRELQKLVSTYIDALPRQVSAKSGRVHTSFNQTIAATGRLSSTNPNLQNIPIRSEDGIRIREAFTAPRGRALVAADYSQIELRILAHLSEDDFLRQAFLDGKDIHTQTASAIYGVFPETVSPQMRRAAKTINFGLMYGMGPVNLSRQLGISFGEAREFIETYFMQFPTIRTFMDRAIESARAQGYTETMLGRRRYLPEIDSDRRQIREAAERTAINTPVQGSAADIIKIAMVTIHAELPAAFPGAHMLLQVHDELVFEVAAEQAPPLREWAVARMSAAYELSVPLKVDAGVGTSWREAH